MNIGAIPGSYNDVVTVIEEILRSPRLPEYLAELKTILRAERAKRQRFIREVGDSRRAEFINGEVILPRLATLENLGASANLARLIGVYTQKHSGGCVGGGRLMISLTRNDYEPDVCFWGTAKAAKFKPKQMRFPAPDLVVEVLSRSTERTDRTIKFEDYAAHGVAEYWIVDPRKRTIEQYLLSGEQYELALKVRDGTVRSRAIKGLEIPVRAVFDGQANLRALAEIVHPGK
jgi:Uma2 family endonuclease